MFLGGHRMRLNCRWPRPKDPFPGWSHWLGAALSVAGLVLLLLEARGRPVHALAFGVYGASLILLYLASATAHSVYCSPRAAEQLDRLDYAAIFVLIAGTYTPICLITLRGPWGWGMLAAVWATAAVGILSLYVGRASSHWPRVITYVVMGWLAVIPARQLARALPAAGIALLVAGGVIYSLGALVFLTDRPRLWPGRFGSHDLWHCMVLVASACHFLVILRFIGPVA